MRDGDNNVILRPIFIKAIQRINEVSEEVATATYLDLLSQTDNQKWAELLRGKYSRSVPGESKKQTIHLIDFLHPENNVFTVTSQFTVRAEKVHRPDLIVFVNGIPVVIIEAKSPLVPKDKSGEAFQQIKQYEKNIPRLFYSNVFNIVTNGQSLFYGATGSPSSYWAIWRDPWPKSESEFKNDKLSQGIYSLLAPERLLDLIAHFVVFEATETALIKKICRYQQFRAVNKIIDRVVTNEHRRGLVWHTQGSGKSLTMVYAALKLKKHQTISSPELENPNILILTDRVDLDDQITKTFVACGFSNPIPIETIQDLHSKIHGPSQGGLTLLSTIFKFADSKKPVPNSKKWILLVDECHRTQEKDLGACLRATFPDARFFGFTGTPIKKSDKDTYTNFGAPGEGYLDKYGIDDAVADGATVPIHYTSRKVEWEVDSAKLDILFDQWFANESEEKIAQLKKRGISAGDVLRHPKRIELIAYDIWTHFKASAFPDGFKAQVVAYDRKAIILYKRALNQVIAADFEKEGLSPAVSHQKANEMSACVYSSSQEDGKPSESAYEESIRADLQKYYLDHDAEKEVKAQFKKWHQPPYFLIVCDKLLTGFDEPLESVMYLDNPLQEHNLLQAIARTNRVSVPEKQNGLIVDYVGVSKKLDDALSTYRHEDVKNAMRNIEELKSNLRTAHQNVIALMKGLKTGTLNQKAEYDQLVEILQSEDQWYLFRLKAKDFIAAYTALSPDPSVLAYQRDLKWIAGFLIYGSQVFEKRPSTDLKDSSEKIRQILDEHLKVIGLSVICKLRHITDPEFWDDFHSNKTEEELKTAAIRKATEMKQITAQKMEANPLRFEKFSQLVVKIIQRLEKKQLSAAEVLKEFEKVAKELEAEEKKYVGSGLSENAYDILRMLQVFSAKDSSSHESDVTLTAAEPSVISTSEKNNVNEVAAQIDSLYSSDKSAPAGWHLKEGLRKSLRQEVRKIVLKAKLSNWKDIPVQIEEYALKHYVKMR